MGVMIIIKIGEHNGREESFYQLIGRHIERTTRFDPEVCIILVGSWWETIQYINI